MNKRPSGKLNVLFGFVLLVFALTVVMLPAQAQDTEDLPLAGPGPYVVGTRELVVVDENRDNREIAVTIWYPAQAEAEGAAPDLSGAPYPLVLYTIGQTGFRLELQYLTQHLASYGFVVAALERGGRSSFSYMEALDRPLDVLFVLEYMASLPADDALSGVVDADHSGVTGYSFGGYTTVAVSGARWDDSYHWQWCTDNQYAYLAACPGERNFGLVAEYRSRHEPPPPEGELWPALTDERIIAVLPLAGAAGPVFGERGLAAATIPMMMITGTADTGAAYQPASVFVYENWGGSERYLLSVVGAHHTFAYTSGTDYYKSIVRHFATAFFGYYLQGRQDYAQYLTEAYVNSVEGLLWGPYGEDAGLPDLVPITADNADQMEQIAAFERDNVCAAAFSPADTLLAYSEPHRVVLWDMVDSALASTLSVDNREVWRITFSTDGTRIAASSTGSTCGDTRVSVWDVASGQLLLQVLDDYEHMATDVAFSPDGTLLAAGASCPLGLRGASSVSVWDVASGTLLLDIPMSGFVSDLAFSPDGRLLAAADGRVVSLWDAAAGTLSAELRGHTGFVRSIAFSPDGLYLASGDDVDVRLWDVASGEQLYLFANPEAQVAFSADGQMLVIADRALTFRETATGELLAEHEIGPEGDYIYSLALNADNTLLATCTHRTMLYLWGVER